MGFVIWRSHVQECRCTQTVGASVKLLTWDICTNLNLLFEYVHKFKNTQKWKYSKHKKHNYTKVHMHKVVAPQRLHLSNYSQQHHANSCSLSPPGVNLDSPLNDLTRPRLWKKLSKILRKSGSGGCQLHWQLQCCYLNLNPILRPWPTARSQFSQQYHMNNP